MESSVKVTPTLAELLDHRDYSAVLTEVQLVWHLCFQQKSLELLPIAWQWIVDLYSGRIEGYAACSTEYHDLQHATDTALALIRMIHGAHLFGVEVDPRCAEVAIIAAIFHDSGFILEDFDKTGTGGKYTKEHVERSKGILHLFAQQRGLDDRFVDLGNRFIDVTDLMVEPDEVDFKESTASLLSRMLAAADLWAQMADRVYLEKLLFLYHELREGGIDLFSDGEELIQKTPQFYHLVEKRLRILGPVIDSFLTLHFCSRWSVDENLYHLSIERQRAYLQNILEQEPEKPSQFLRRDGIVDRVNGHLDRAV